MKDHLCTLLITFNDFDDPLKETTTAHSFASTNPQHYPQQRRVVHSIQHENVKSMVGNKETNAITKRTSRSAHAANAGILGSDFIENRIYQVRQVTPSVRDGDDEIESTLPPLYTHISSESQQQMSPPFVASPILSHTCTSSSAGESPTPTNQLNIQEVTLTYMRDADAATTTRFGLSAAGSAASSTTNFPSAGSLEFTHRKLERNIAHVPPYKVHENGVVKYNDPEYLEISDVSRPSNKVRDTTNFYPVPLKEDKFREKYAQSALSEPQKSQKARHRIRFDNNLITNTNSNENNNIDQVPRRIFEKRALANDSSMENWQKPFHHHRNESSYESVEEHLRGPAGGVDGGGGGAKTSRKIYERTTSEVTLSKSTTTTFHPLSQSRVNPHSPQQQQKQQDQQQQHRPAYEQRRHHSAGREPHFDASGYHQYQQSSERSQFAQSDNSASTRFGPYSPKRQRSPSGGLPRYHDDDIRLYTRYDDDFVFRGGVGRNTGAEPRIDTATRSTQRIGDEFATNFPSATESTFEENRYYSRTGPQPTHTQPQSQPQKQQHQQQRARQPSVEFVLPELSSHYPRDVSPDGSPALWRHYEFEEEEELYYERIREHISGPGLKSSSGVSDGEPASKVHKPTTITPFGSTKNFSEAQERMRAKSPPHSNADVRFVSSLPPTYSSQQQRDEDSMRQIDYNTYRQEVEQLQREAMGLTRGLNVRTEEPIPLTPAIVLSPSAAKEERPPSTLKYFNKSDFDETQQIHSQTPANTPVVDVAATSGQSSRERILSTDITQISREHNYRENAKEEFGRKIEAIQTSPGFRPLHQEAPTLEKNGKSPPSKITSTASIFLSNTTKTSKTSPSVPAATEPAATGRPIQAPPQPPHEGSRPPIETTSARGEESTKFPASMSAAANLEQPHASDAKRSREFQEVERQEFLEHRYQPEPASSKSSTYVEEYEFRHRQEQSPDSDQHRKPIYLEKATLQSIDISVERETPVRTTFSNVADDAPITTATSETTTTTFSAQRDKQAKPRVENVLSDSEMNLLTESLRQVERHKYPVETSEMATQKDGVGMTVDEGTDPEHVPIGHDAETQVDPTDDEGTGTVTGKELLETLRRELQYEELVDLEVRRRQRIFHDNDAPDDQLAPVDEAEPHLEAMEAGDTLETREHDAQDMEDDKHTIETLPPPVSEVEEMEKMEEMVIGDVPDLVVGGGGDVVRGEDLVETFETKISEERSGATSEINEGQEHTPQPSTESADFVDYMATQTTDVPQGRILADAHSDAETMLQEDFEYEARTLTPPLSRRRTSQHQQQSHHLSQPQLQHISKSQLHQGDPPAYTARHLQQYEEERRAYEDHRQFFPTPPHSHPQHRQEQLQYREFDPNQTQQRETVRHHESRRHEPHPYQQHQQHPHHQHHHQEPRKTAPLSPLLSPPYSRPTQRPESVTSTKTTTIFSPLPERSTSAAEIRPARPQSSSPLRTLPATRFDPKMEYSSASDYRSNISSRQNYSHGRPGYRTVSPTPASHRVLKMVSETSSLSSGPFSPYAGSTAASTIRDAREREKKDLSDLNDRLASYIEKVRFLEAQNRKLATDLDFLHNRWGKDTSSIRDMYEVDIKQAQKLIDETNSQREEMEDKIKKLEEEIGILRRKFQDAERSRYADKETIDELLLKLSALEAEIALLKRRIAILEEEVSATKRDNHRLLNELQHARNDLDQQTLNRIDYQNQVQTLIEEIDFLRRAHESEIHDLQAMASRDTTSENREYFRNELSSAMRDIRSEYDKVCNVTRVDMESWYKLKVQEIQTQSVRQNMEQSYAKEEIRRLRVQLGDLRGKLADLEGRNALLEKQAEELNYQLEDDQRSYESALNDRDSQIRKIRDECQMLMVELQMLLDTKQTLDAEIAIYRKMLEGEEDRAGLRQLVEQVVRTHQFKQSDEAESVRVLRGETSSRQSYQRSAKGNVSIWEVSPDGRFISIENTHRSRAENIGEWKLRRRIDNGKREIYFTFPRDFTLGPGKTVKIWARNQGPYNPPDELVFEEEESFGTGTNVQNFLYNTQGEERATLIQRSNHTASGH